MIVRTGIDLIELSRLEQVNPAIRQRFLERVYTPLELEQVGRSLTSLTGRFAAKEAVSKALGTGIGWVRWREIEIQRGLAGEPVLVLYGNARLAAEKQGLTDWSVSITHDRTHAAAFVVALGDAELHG